MKVLFRLGTQENIFQEAYSAFSNNCLRNKPTLEIAKNNFQEIRDLFIKNKQLENFCEKTLNLSEELSNQGEQKLNDMIINELSKLCLRYKLPMAENILKISIENSRKKGDGLHVLARLTDLEELYKSTRNRKSLFFTLKQKKECCKQILENYDSNIQNFDSIHKKPTSREGIQTQLAYTYSDLASLLERRKPKDAINLYSKSQDIYVTLQKEQESKYLKEKIKRLQTRFNLTPEQKDI